MKIRDVAAVWVEQEEFHLQLGLDLWADGYIQFPFGRLTLEAENLLFIRNVDGFTPREIIALCRKHIGNNKLSFYFTPASTGKIATFKTYLRGQGYHLHKKVIWHVLDKLTPQKILPGSSAKKISIKDASEPVYGRIHCAVFGSDEYIKAKTLRAMKGLSLVKNSFVAVQAGGRAVGVAACAYAGDIGYLHSLAVLPDARRHGYGRALVDARLQLMKNNGVKRIFTAVFSDNKASMELQKKLGYEPFCTCQYWKL